MSKLFGRKKRIIITTAAMLAIGGGAAFAYWTSTATQDATVASTADSTSITVSVAAFSGSLLAPGAAAQTATFTVANPGSGVQKVSAMAVTVQNPDGTPWTVGTCSAADFAVSATITPTELAANTSTTGTVTLQMINRPGVDQNACKNAQVPLHFVAS